MSTNSDVEPTSDAFLEEMDSSFAAGGDGGETSQEGHEETFTNSAGASNGGGGGGGGSSSVVPDIMLLNILCARTRAPKDVHNQESRLEAALSWQPVREWLAAHDAETVRAAAEQRGESGLTALHFACRNVPPLDVIEVFLSIAGDTVQWPDSFGWLPIHYACASGSDSAVIHALAESFPESKTTTDRRGRTPLHFALGDKPASPDVIVLLSSSGAASYPDEIGMLVCTCVCAGNLMFCVDCVSVWCLAQWLLFQSNCIFLTFALVLPNNSPSITPAPLAHPKKSCLP